MEKRDYSAVSEGIRKFVRLIPLRTNPAEEKYIQDEFDLLEGLDVVLQKFQETAEMFGKKKYRDTPFNFCEDVHEEIEEWLLNHEDQVKAAVLRKRYQPMYHLVLSPVIDLFSRDTHAKALMEVRQVIEDIQEMIRNNDYVGTYDDAMVARALISKDIHTKEQARLTKRTRRQRKVMELIEDAAELSFE